MKYILWLLIIVLSICACDNKTRIEVENKDIIRQWIEEWDNGNEDNVVELLSPDAVIHYPNKIELNSSDALIGEKEWYKAFPDTKHIIDDLVAEGDKIVLRETIIGTHLGNYQGIEPTGKKIRFTAILIYRIKEGKIIEIWAEGDLTGFIQSLTN